MSVISSLLTFLFTRIVWFAGKKNYNYLQILMLTNGNIIIQHTMSIITVSSIKCTRKNILDIRKQIQYVILLSDGRLSL